LVLHGSNGVDGRGAFYAEALQNAGIATLEIVMFPPGGRPQAGSQATLPHAAAALKWLVTQPNVDGQRLGVVGFSWGGSMALWMSSEDTQERMGKDVPRPAAFASFYPVCSSIARYAANPQSASGIAQARMSAAPMLIFVGTRDDYEEDARPCDALVAMWPAAAREHATVRYLEGATHGFDSQTGPRTFNDQFAHAGKGGTVNVIPDPKAAAQARLEVVRFFTENLKP
jgi:dienelactone hydrolase